MRSFFLLWFGQLGSMLGSQMTGFALGVWVYQRTQSSTLLAIMMALHVIPTLLLMPLAGIVADRWNRRAVMFMSDLGAALCTLLLLLGLYFRSESFPLWGVGLSIFGNAAFSTFFRPAYSAAIAQLVRPEELNRSNGLVQVSDSIGQLVAPVLGGIVLAQFGLQAVLLIDIMTFILASSTQIIIKIPAIPPQPIAMREFGPSTWKSELNTGWKFLRYRPALLSLVLFFSLKNIFTSMSYVLMTPYILSFAPVSILGLMLSSGGMGMFFGSLLLSLLPDRRIRIQTICFATIFSGIVLALVAIRQSIPLFLLGSFSFFLALPLIHGSGQIIFQRKVPSAIQGKVFALNEAIAGAAVPLGYLLAGPLSDCWFEPGMQPEGFLSPIFGSLVGVGKGRGVALIFLGIGLVHIIGASWMYRHRSLRTLEWKLPDTIVQKPLESEAI